MSDFGAKLRQARERRGVSLRQIAASTKISVSALDALERNDISKLPGGLFSRAFVRSYAIEVGLDPEETVRQFVESFHDIEPVQEARAVVTEDESQFENERRIAGVVLTLLIISIPIAGVILYFTYRAHASPSNGHAEAPSASAVASAPPAAVRSAPESRAVPPSVPPAPIAQTSKPASSASAASAASAPLTLDFHPTGRCWVAMTADGHKVFAKMMEPGERLTRTASREAVIEVGDAGVFAYSINGREARPLGGNGQVKTLRLTPESAAQYIR